MWGAGHQQIICSAVLVGPLVALMADWGSICNAFEGCAGSQSTCLWPASYLLSYRCHMCQAAQQSCSCKAA